MKKQNNISLQDLLSKRAEAFEVVGTPTQMAFECRIDDDFEHPSQFADLVSVLENANEGDHVRISLCTDGGALHSILPLLGAMEMTQAHVHVHAASDVASAGTFLLMRAHSVSMNDYVTVMFHEVSFGSGGTGSRVAGHVAHTMKSSQKIIRDMYQHFFSEDELEKLLSGKEYYMDRDEFVERYEKRMEALYDASDEPCGNDCEGCSCKNNEQMSVEEIKQEITQRVDRLAYDVVEVQNINEEKPRKIPAKKVKQAQPA